MPWCEDCSHFWNAKDLAEGGNCPTCGTHLEAAGHGVPWHFKLLLVGLSGYLVYRVYWFIEWLPKHV